MTYRSSARNGAADHDERKETFTGGDARDNVASTDAATSERDFIDAGVETRMLEQRKSW